MPTKSNNMSPMPMQSKIGDASLKFGPDWLRALSSSENTGGPSSTSPGGDGVGGPPPRGFGFSGWGPGPEGRSGFHSNSNKDHQHHNYSAAAAAFSSPPSSSFHPVSYHQSPRGGGEANKGTGIPSNPNRFKQSEHRYSREEMLALYDKNLESPEFLLTFGTLYIEKMQPPLAFSQPSEEEIRIWHIPQPESSRQGPGGAAPIGRGYATRGRGGGIDRGRGRGRGSYSTYGPRTHEEEDPRSSFSRPRNFERSQSNHERTAWGDRNGVVGSVGGPPGVAGPEESNRGGGSWRSRESFGGRRVSEEGTNDDGWRKPRWRRGDEAEDEYRSGSNSRRLHRSWSEEENHDNIPEWARDNPSEESGTFDSSGAFHGEDRSSKSSRETDNRKGGENSGDSNSGNSLLKSRGESEHLGSHSDRVQKRVQDRTESVKPVIPASVKEEAENNAGDDHDEYSSSLSNNRTSRDRDPFLTLSNSSHQQQQQQQQQQYHHQGSKNSIINIQKQLLESESHDRSGHLIGLSSSESHHIQRVQTVQHQMTASSHDSRSQLLHAQSLVERAASGHGLHGGELRASSNTNESNMPSLNNEDDHYRSMTEEAMNLVSKLIEEDTLASRRLRGPSGNNAMSQQQQQLLASLSVAETLSSSGGNKQQQQQSSHNDLSRSGPGGGGHHPSQNIPSQNTTTNVTVHQPASSPSGSMEVWFYRDPQGSVQGPFSTHEMGLWCSQGYFSGSLQLRRECDKIFITLLEMGKVYGRNPFAVADSSPPPPPIQDPNASSALDHSSQIQAQLHQQRQQALLQQQNLMREQQQYMMNLNHGGGGAIRKEQQDPSWHQPQSSSIPPVVAPQQTRSASNSSLSSEQIQAQLLMSMAKSQGLDRDQSAMDQLHALYQRQLKTAGNETLQSQNKNNFSDLMGNSQSTPTMDVASNKSSSAVVNDPIQSLVQQLTSMANTQHKIISTPSKPPDVISPWGQTGNSSVQQQQQTPQVQNQWGAAQPTQTPWEYREQMAKLQEEELRRRKEEEEAERKRLEEEERKHLEDKQRIEHERKRLEEQQRMEEEKQRKIREEQYLLQKQQQEILRKQQEEAEFQRLKDLQRQQLEQQRQLRDEQTRLAEEQQKLEEQRLEKERKEQVAAEREVKLRQERERELKLQQQAQFSWNTATVQPTQNMAGGVAGSGGSKSLLEIQQEEAIKQEKEQASQKKKAQQEQLRQQQAQQQKAINLKWVANAGAAPTKQAPIKSLTEIQAEEQAKLQKQQDQEREKRAIINQQQQKQAVWSAQLTWADRALAGTGGGSSSSSGTSAKKVNGGVWDDSMASMASKLKGSNNPLPSSVPSSSSSNNNNRGPAGGKKTKEISDDSFMKLFSVQQDGAATNQKGGSNRPKMTQQAADEFTRWCSDRIQAIASGSVDIPTFVSFLKEVESPYEVGDYVRSYLGDGKEAKEFSREFLERRSRWKNARKGDGLTSSMEDNLCRPASAINPNSNEFQEVKAKGKKTKKNKMQKVDSRILGFSTSTVTDRLSREYCDSTD
ncbi:GRB10-interacting GYF protein 2 [Folsomia candida]|uniref:PERQ amino acid-rich with GYF domain-containing protein 2 n=1 Tax=Folsomia candida TaxID=158441 RepID=A0A226E2A1_FOLCA|nr:GRB10-interacting GYF protein 2 [Folsomia candida]OXA51693.1 PERQ amino acid-rich with GYF domain-containing protein 2 [Folsomia candida]